MPFSETHPRYLHMIEAPAPCFEFRSMLNLHNLLIGKGSRLFLDEVWNEIFSNNACSLDQSSVDT